MSYNKEYYKNLGDLDKWREIKNKGKRAYNARTSEWATNAMQRWTLHEIDKLVNHTGTDRELAIELGRSVNAIQNARSKLKHGGYKSEVKHE